MAVKTNTIKNIAETVEVAVEEIVDRQELNTKLSLKLNTTNPVVFKYFYINNYDEETAQGRMRSHIRDNIWTCTMENSDAGDDLTIRAYAFDATGSITIQGNEVYHSGNLFLVGEIKQYSGKIADLPQGWHICNGTKGTPDMTQDFKTYGTTDVVYIMYTGGN